MKTYEVNFDDLIGPNHNHGDLAFSNLASEHNGDDPACLRLRAVMTKESLQAVNPMFIVENDAIDQRQNWVSIHYRDKLIPSNLLDPDFAEDYYSCLAQLTSTLALGQYYDFQKG